MNKNIESATTVEQEELRGIARSVGEIEWLLMIVVLGVTLLSTSIISMHGLSILPATQIMTLMLMELVFAAASAWLLAGEHMQLQEYIGGALIASASLLSGRIVAKPRAQPALAGA